MPRRHPALTDAELEDLEFLAANKVGLAEAAHRLGYNTPDALDRALRRIGHPDLRNTLRRHDPLTPDQIRNSSAAAHALTLRGVPRKDVA